MKRRWDSVTRLRKSFPREITRVVLLVLALLRALDRQSLWR